MMARPEHGTAARWLIYAFIAAMVSLTALPVLWPKGKDSFPHSSYPMFSSARRTAAMRLTYALGVGKGDLRVFIPPDFLGVAASHLPRSGSRAPGQRNDSSRSRGSTILVIRRP